MKKAFTLIEILIVIIIIGTILSSAAIVYQKALVRQREINAQKTLGVIFEAERDYYNFQATGGGYTSSWDKLDIPDPSIRDQIYTYNIIAAPSLCIEAVHDDLVSDYREFHITEEGLDDEGHANEGPCPGLGSGN